MAIISTLSFLRQASEKAEGNIAKRSIIIADSDLEDVSHLHDALLRQAFIVDYAHTARDLKKSLSEVGYDIVILGMTLPDADGLAVLQWLRLMPHRPGILVRSGTDDEVDRVVALELGADDCVTISCSLREIIARVRAISRRRSGDSVWDTSSGRVNGEADLQTTFTFSGWVLHSDSRQIMVPTGEVIQLTDTEYIILKCLLSEPGAIKDRFSLRGTNPEKLPEDIRSTDVLVSRLRKKLAKYGGKDLIQTVRGEGYRLTSLPQPHLEGVGTTATDPAQSETVRSLPHR
jgi:DNA-binding response OmpR family regulator